WGGNGSFQPAGCADAAIGSNASVRTGSIEKRMDLLVVFTGAAASIQLAAVWELYASRVGAMRAIFCRRCHNGDLHAFGQRVLLPTIAEQHVGRTELDSPGFDLAVRLRNVDIQPGVRVDPFHFLYGALENKLFFF